jgi:upstream activation factor subunit UAF30
MLVKVLAPVGHSDGLRNLTNGKLKLYSNEIDFRGNVTSVQMVATRDEEQRTLTGTAAAGIVGAALAGPLGAIGGMLFGGRKRQISDITVTCSLISGQTFVLRGSYDLLGTLQSFLVSSQAVATPQMCQVDVHPNSSKTVREICLETGKSERSVKAQLYREGLSCKDYDGAALLSEAMRDKTPEDRELRLHEKYISELKAADDSRKSGDKGIIFSVKGIGGSGVTINSFISCHDATGDLVKGFEFYNSVEHDHSLYDEDCVTSFKPKFNVETLLDCFMLIEGPSETTRIFEKKYPKSVAYFSIWAATFAEDSNISSNFSEVELEIHWDGIEGKRDAFSYKTGEHVTEQVILLGYLARQKNNQWEFCSVVDKSVGIAFRQISLDPKMYFQTLSLLFQSVLPSYPDGVPQEPQRQRNARGSKGKSTKSAVEKTFTPSADLAVIVGAAPLHRGEVVDLLWSYILKNKLQDESNRRMINADSKLLTIFQRPQISMLDISDLIDKHLI